MQKTGAGTARVACHQFINSAKADSTRRERNCVQNLSRWRGTAAFWPSGPVIFEAPALIVELKQ